MSIDIESSHIINGDAIEKLKEIPDNSIDMVMTSPPYWALRDYGDGTDKIWDDDPDCDHEFDEIKTKQNNLSGGNNNKNNKGSFAVDYEERTTKSAFCKKCGAWKGQLGLEPDFKLYIKHLADIFDEIWRVLKPEGTCWVNIGDTYSGTNDKKGYEDPKNKKGRNGQKIGVNKNTGLKAKSLVQIPHRFAIEMSDRGWILRNTIIWNKPNAMPSSVKDRFTVDFEYLFFFTKQKKYYFEQQFEPYTKPLNRWGGDNLKADGKSDWDEGTGQTTYRKRNLRPDHRGRNKRTTWYINPKPFREAHFAVYPRELVETPLKAGCPENGIVLDPFAGAGTTAVEAKRQGKRYIGIELSEKYADIARKRVRKEEFERF